MNDLLDISKIVAGKMDLHVDAFSLQGVVGGVDHMLKGKALLKGIAITATVDSAVPDRMMGDSSRLKQCLVRGGGILGDGVGRDPVKCKYSVGVGGPCGC